MKAPIAISLAEELFNRQLHIELANCDGMAYVMLVISSRARLQGHFDIDAAGEDYLDRLKGIFEPNGWEVTDRGKEIKETRVNQDPIRREWQAKALIERAAQIDVIAILNTHKDDGWVVTEGGKVYDSKNFAVLYAKMDQQIVWDKMRYKRELTNQEFAAEYATIHERETGKRWEAWDEIPTPSVAPVR